MILAAGWWTTNHILVLTNVVLAVATIGSALAALVAVRASNTVAGASTRQATSSEKQAKATDDTVAAALQQLEQGAEQLRLGQQQLEKEREALELSVRPIIVDDYQATAREHNLVMHSSDSFYFSIPVRNIGSGPAFVQSVLFTSGVGTVEEAETVQMIIPPTESTFVTRQIKIGHYQFAIIQGDPTVEVAVGVKYSDVANGQRTQTNVRIRRNTKGEWNVVSVELYHCNEEWNRDVEPFVATGLRR